jgi:hypothetical protein
MFNLTSCFWDSEKNSNSKPQASKQVATTPVYKVQPLRAYEGKWIMLNQTGQTCSTAPINYDKFDDSFKIFLSIDNDQVQLSFHGYLYSPNCRDGKQEAELVDTIIARGRLIQMDEEKKFFRFQIKITDLQRKVGNIKYDYKDHSLVDELNIPTYQDNPACNFDDWKVGTYSIRNRNFSFIKDCNKDMRGEMSTITLDNPIYKSLNVRFNGTYYVAMQMMGKDGMSVATSDKADVQPTGVKNYIRYRKNMNDDLSDEESEEEL